MPRLFVALLLLAFGTRSLLAQAPTSRDSLRSAAAGTYRVEIHSPMPRGIWAALIILEPVSGGYQGTFRDPDGPGTYPVASVAVIRDSMRITMAGEATGSVFFLKIQGDSLLGYMTSTTHGDTPVSGARLRH